MNMVRSISDSTADKFIVAVLVILAISCLSGALGMLFVLPLVAYMASKCDIKLLPAIMLSMISPANIKAFAKGYTVLRLGITIKPDTMFIIVVFVVTIISMLRGSFRGRGYWFFPIWMLAIVPAAVISYNAKNDNVPEWSRAIMYFMIPSFFYWGVLVSRTYNSGRVYFFKRMFYIFTCVGALYLLQVGQLNSYLRYPIICSMVLYIIFDKTKSVRISKAWLVVAVIVAILEVTVGRYLHIIDVGREALNAEKSVSGFSVLGTFITTIVIAYIARRKVPFYAKFLPVTFLLINISLVSFVVLTQSGNEEVEVSQQFENMEERFKYKLFGDRATVWQQGWEQIKDPPYVFVDLRKYVGYNPMTGNIENVVLPHNELLTQLSRNGYWLGGVLLLFTLWVQMRAFADLYKYGRDSMLRVVYLPTGCAIFFILGTCGQSVITIDLWLNSLACFVMPGIVVGQCFLARKYQQNLI